MKNIFFFSTLVLALLTGCSSMNKSECLTADWHTIGFEDGAAGKNETSISEYRKDCAEHGVTPDLAAYRRGHYQGAESFCTSRNGFMLGRKGSQYQNSCPAALEADFLNGYRDGQYVFNLQRDVNTARQALDKQQHILAQLDDDIAVKTNLLVEDGLTRDQRIDLLEQIEQLKYHAAQIADTLPTLEQQLKHAEQALAAGNRKMTHYL